ncbi:MAG: radical SAM protein [bacterium]|nr:radical SAM protein [bacterium]
MPIKKTPTLKMSAANVEQNLSLSLIVTRDCNLACSYCYEKHENRDKRIMDLSVAKEKITHYMERDDDFAGMEVEFFGGEPLLAFPLIRDTVEWFQSREWPKKSHFSIGTNGTVMNGEISEWLTRNRKTVTAALSLDGNKTAHDISRDNSYDRVLENLPFFTGNWPDQAAKMTINAETIPHVADSIIHLEETKVYYTANIVFEDIWGDEHQKRKLLEIYEGQLSRLVDYFAERPKLYPPTPMLDVLPEHLGLADSLDEIKKEFTRYCGAGHEMKVVDVDGKEYPCHRFLPWVTNRPAPEMPSNRQTRWQPDKCADCKLILSCPTCAGFNWEINGDTGNRTIFHCEAHKLEAMASARLEAIRLQQLSNEDLEDLSPEEISRTYKRLTAILDIIENGF